MMQSNADFIPAFAKKAALLRELTIEKVRFRWEQKHQKCFEQLIATFRKDVLLRYFDLSKQTYLFTDAHITRLGAILAQGDSLQLQDQLQLLRGPQQMQKRSIPR